ncbi:MAG: HU family DNA-binding protein [Synergistaceae bacterium]|nr:HU family DNA-binding protein [Synergistaceae bacterium]MBR0035663.1 HU family DNA-binding protein [Synergistaceae bacterium]
MTRSDLVDAIAAKLSMKKKDVAPVVDEVFAQILTALVSGDRCVIAGFGVFKVAERAAREGHNPQNPSEKVQIPARKVAVFRPGKELRETVRG